MEHPRGSATRIRALLEQLEAVDDQIEQLARPIEQAAHAIFGARRRYTRAGQWPHVDRERITDDSVGFRISNGIDHGDDFHASLTWEELAADPAVEAEKETQRRRKAEEKAAREQIAAGERRLARAKA